MDSRASPSGLHPFRGRGTAQLGNLCLRSVAPLLCGGAKCVSSRGAPPSHLETRGAPHQGSGDHHIPSNINTIIILCVASVVTVPQHVCDGVVLRGRRGAWGNGALLVGAHPTRVGGWAVCGTALACSFGGYGQWETRMKQQRQQVGWRQHRGCKGIWTRWRQR